MWVKSMRSAAHGQHREQCELEDSYKVGRRLSSRLASAILYPILRLQ